MRTRTESGERCDICGKSLDVVCDMDDVSDNKIGTCHYEPSTFTEDILIALAAGELSEGQAHALLGMDRVDIRSSVIDSCKRAYAYWQTFREKCESWDESAWPIVKNQEVS